MRSQKEKRYEELSNIFKTMRNHKKIKDIGNMLSSFEDFTKAYTKAQPVIMKEEKGVVPKFVIRFFVELEDFINVTWEDKDGRKNMSKNNGKLLGTLRQKFRKYVKDTSFEIEIKKFRDNPTQADQDEANEAEKPTAVDSDSDDDAPPKAVSFEKKPEAKIAKAKVVKADDDSDDSMDWGSDSETSSSSEDDDPSDMRKKFLKKVPVDGDKDEDKPREKKTKEKKLRKTERAEDQPEDDDEGGWETVPKYGTSEKPKMFAKDAEIDTPVVLSKLNEVMSNRGKKKTDRKLQIEFLHELKAIAEQHNLGAAIAVKIRFNIVSAIFDYNLKISEPMKLENWKKLLEVS